MSEIDFPVAIAVREGIEVELFAQDHTWPNGEISRAGDPLAAIACDGSLIDDCWLRQNRPVGELPSDVRTRAAKFDRDVWKDPVAIEASRLRDIELEAHVRIADPLIKARHKQAEANQTTQAREAKDYRSKALEMLKTGYWVDAAERRCRITFTAVGNALGWPKSTTQERWSNVAFREMVGADVVEQLTGD